jgi:hypothetical protein
MMQNQPIPFFTPIDFDSICASVGFRLDRHGIEVISKEFHDTNEIMEKTPVSCYHNGQNVIELTTPPEEPKEKLQTVQAKAELRGSNYFIKKNMVNIISHILVSNA